MRVLTDQPMEPGEVFPVCKRCEHAPRRHVGGVGECEFLTGEVNPDGSMPGCDCPTYVPGGVFVVPDDPGPP